MNHHHPHCFSAMQPPTSSLSPFSLLLLLLLLSSILHPSLALNQEGQILLAAKLPLPGWSAAAATPCNWTGVACDSRGSVASLALDGASLAGSFPISLCSLPSLSNLSLSNNYLNSSLPAAISACRNLATLDLSQNLLVGPLPPSLSDLPFLRYLNLEGNSFSGEIPPSFGGFRRLETLILTENLLSGAIPAALGNITTLKKLVLAYNPFFQSPIPPELGNLTNLEELWLSDCSLTGSIPSSFGRLQRLRNLDLSDNVLSGPIPSHIVELISIEQMELYNNSFSGPLPHLGWSNLTKLRRFDASMNHLSGIIPFELCGLPLESLNLFQNELEGMIPESITRSKNLYELKLFGNPLTGLLPRELGKNSALQIIDVSYCNLTGGIPEFLCWNGALEELVLIYNAFSGSIPASLGKCRTLQRVRFRGNGFSGEVPGEFWGLPDVYLLDLDGNSFSGGVSPLIAGARNLSTLSISSNRFSGSLPREIGSLDALIQLSARNNELSGEIPNSIVNLRQLGSLDLSNNGISGGIPNGIHHLKQLNELNLAQNRLSGPIPDEIGSLPVLNYLDLSRNGLSGVIPLSLQNLKLNKLNLSSNLLTGNVPPLFASEVYRDSFLGNPGLCSDASGACSVGVSEHVRVFSWMLRSIFAAAAFVLLVGVVWFVFKYRRLERMRNGADLTKWTSFHKLGFSEFEITDCLKEANVIGRGASGKVYKVVLSNGEAVAVKKLHERDGGSFMSSNDNSSSLDSDSDGFEAEVETLGRIRHKNIVRLWCCCSARRCKLLVYEYLPNGSLGDLLHKGTKKLLGWPTRFKIALDAAEGLSYLHHDSVPPIVHRDVKSNNILLDHEFGAKISDFGVAKVVKTASNGVESMSVIAGSCGYIAPEYAYTLRVNEKSDIYSFGVVLLELVTGRPPVDPEYGEKDLVSWVRATLESKGTSHVVDPELDSGFEEHICRVLDVGLLCTSSLPINRPSMRRVVIMLQELGANMPNLKEKEANIFTTFDKNLG
ncbi:receptor-like protein kinase HSL1 [Salvia miltiorrhiza]|uniref:receptor-like protein kinase HSL1 n=1 Tax=Salvia miltiorrhiza TaxID=226208 RepID=UPI0025AB5F4A|nr:receptor-like protein kinase HSL1 [Salvia miltiorrhiza]